MIYATINEVNAIANEAYDILSNLETMENPALEAQLQSVVEQLGKLTYATWKFLEEDDQ